MIGHTQEFWTFILVGIGNLLLAVANTHDYMKLHTRTRELEKLCDSLIAAVLNLEKKIHELEGEK